MKELLLKDYNGPGKDLAISDPTAIALHDTFMGQFTALEESLKANHEGGGNQEAIDKIVKDLEGSQDKIDANAVALQSDADARVALEAKLMDLEARVGRGEFAAGKDTDGIRSAAEKAYMDAYEGVLRDSGNQSARGAAAEAWQGYREEYHGRFNLELSRDIAEGGGNLVAPPEMEAAIDRIVTEIDPIRELARVTTISRESLTTVTNTRGFAVRNRGERQAVIKTATGLYIKQRFTSHNYEAEPAATSEMLEDSAFNLVDHINSEVAISIAEDEGFDFVSGDGVGRAFGFLDADTYISTVATPGTRLFYDQVEAMKTGVNGGLPATDPFNPITSLQESMKTVYAERAKWLMSRTTRGLLRQETDTHGRPLWVPDLTAGVGAPLMGSPVVISQSMPSLATTDALCIAYADWDQFYRIVDRLGLILIVDNITNKGVTLYWFRKRTGGDIYKYEAGKFLKSAA